MAGRLPLFPVPTKRPVNQGNTLYSLIPNDRHFIWLVYAPPDSGKSTFVTNLITREDYGFRGRRKNLITREAQKDVADDNVYDPQVLVVQDINECVWG